MSVKFLRVRSCTVEDAVYMFMLFQRHPFTAEEAASGIFGDRAADRLAEVEIALETFSIQGRAARMEDGAAGEAPPLRCLRREELGDLRWLDERVGNGG